MKTTSAAPHSTSPDKIRIVTAAALFDGHDAAINVMRRILQAEGAEVIHLGHNRSAGEVVSAAIQEDVNAIALTSYQGGHTEYFKYIRKLLNDNGASHVRIFGGGGGTILPLEIDDLQKSGVTRIYSPDDGRRMGLEGMIREVIDLSKHPTGEKPGMKAFTPKDPSLIANWITFAEAKGHDTFAEYFAQYEEKFGTPKRKSPVLGITGTGGAGKSSLIDEIVRRFITAFPNKTLAILSIDPSKRKTGGALLGDRIRMNSIHHPNIFMRSMATRQAHRAVSGSIADTLKIYQAAGFDFIIVETSGIGQSDTEILDHSDTSLYVMTPEYGAATQLEKIDMLDFADLVAINKFDRKGSLDALRDVRKQWARNRKIFDLKENDIPVLGTIASQFNDAGTWDLFFRLIKNLNQKAGADLVVPPDFAPPQIEPRQALIPGNRIRYLAEISESIYKYDREVESEAQKAEILQHLKGTVAYLQGEPEVAQALAVKIESLEKTLKPETLRTLNTWPATKAAYKAPEYSFQVRDRKYSISTQTESLAKVQVPKVATPRTASWGDWVRFEAQENVPGRFPYTSGVFPFKREEEDPTRMFAGEGTPERTNRRFHYISKSMPAKRLSTAFDSVTLYGEDPDLRPDIYGKIGNSGVSVCTLDDAKKLYSGFVLSDPMTSVSMTINGPAPMLVAFFLNAAIDQECETHIRSQGIEKEVEEKIAQIFKTSGMNRPKYSGPLPEGHNGLGLMLLGITGREVLPTGIYEKIKAETLTKVRGTVQADILKEDQAQNTCIFSTEFAIKMMGDIQGYFIDHKIRNFYSVSVSGYHIAEAGANPITQLAFTLSNGFTFVEYYLSRGYKIDDFAANLSFFFSNGLDPEYAVIGRVARRIWAKAMKMRYGANPRSQMLKYHIQTSGRSLHAQEIDFNDIRTTLQALYAIFDNCNSLHTNAYDEAITTPTEESVRRAIAIQHIINKELGLSKNQNPFQGSYVIEELTDLVEGAVLKEFDRINERGGVFGAMETMYQRGKIQEESLHYETLKHTGELPVIGVNTYLSAKGSPTVLPKEVIRSTEEEKMEQIENLKRFQDGHAGRAKAALRTLKAVAIRNENVFETLMEVSPFLSLGDMTLALYEVGGQYRRNM